MLNAGVSLAHGLAAARLLFGPNFQPSESLKALVYHEDGDLTPSRPQKSAPSSMRRRQCVSCQRSHALPQTFAAPVRPPNERTLLSPAPACSPAKNFLV